LVVIANVGAFWFSQSFKVGVAVLVVSLFAVTWLLVRQRKSQLVRMLRGVDQDTQDAVLAELDADDRKEILRKLGRDNA
jgi:hypothetical protein